MDPASRLRVMMLPLLVAAIAWLPQKAAAQDGDGDRIPDAVELRLGTDPHRAEQFELISDDKAQGAGDETIGSSRKLAPDILDLSVANVAGNRYVWRIRFAQDFLAAGTVLILYVDADDDLTTGRQDKEFARGTDIMYNIVNGKGGIQVHTDAVRERPELPPRWAVVGDTVYFSDDVKLAQANGKTHYRAYVLCHRQDPTSDADTTPWTTVQCSGDSARPKPPLPFPENEGFSALPAWYELIHELTTARDTVRLPLDGARLTGFVLQGDGGILASSEEASAALTVPKSGRYYVAFELYDQPGAVEGIVVRHNGKQLGTAAGFSPVRRRILFVSDDAVAVKKGDALELALTHGTTAARLGGVILVKDRPKPPALRMEHVATYAPIPDPGQEPRVAVCWTTNRAAHGRLLVAVGDDEAVVDEGRGPVNNHRVYLRDAPPSEDEAGDAASAGRLPGLLSGKSYDVKIECWEEPDPQKLFEPQRANAGPISVTGKRPKPKERKAGSVALTVEEPTASARAAWPVTSGVPLPKGALADAREVEVLGPDARPVLAQSRALTYWPDGSVKWLLVDFDADTNPELPRAYTLRYGVQPAGLSGRLAIADAPQMLTVDTGPMQIRIPKARFSPLEDVRIDGNGDGRFDDAERLTRPVQSGFLIVRQGDGTLLTARALPPDQFAVEDAGPVRSTIVIRGPLGTPDGKPRLRYIARLRVFAGKPWARLVLSLDNDILQPRMSDFQAAFVRLNVPLAGATCDFGAGEPLTVGKKALRLLQDYDNRVMVQGQEAQEERAPGYAYLSGERKVMGFVRNFWQLYPKGLRVDRNGLVVDILPRLPAKQYDNERDGKLLERLYYWCDEGRYKLSSGVRLTTEMWFDFDAPDSPEAAAQEAEHFQHPLFAAASPDWYCESGALGDLMPQRKGVFDLWNAQLAKAFDGFLKRRRDVREYGFLNYGDWFGERTWNWGNIEYDTPWALALQFLRSGNIGFFRAGEPAARHNGDTDTIHADAREPNVGRVHVHCMGHTGGYFPAGYRNMGGGFTSGSCTVSHTWDQGQFAYYVLTGDRGYLDNARLVADQIAGYQTTNYDFGSERDCGWALIAMMSAYRYTGDPFYLNAAHIMAERAVQKQDPDRGLWGHFIGECKHTPRHWGAKPFMTGILLKGLKMYDQEAPSEEVKQAIVRCCDFLWRECWRENGPGFIYAQCSTFEDHGQPWCWTLVGEGLMYGYELRPTREQRELIVKAVQANLYRAPCSSFGKSFTQGTIQWPYTMTALARRGIKSVEPPPEAKPQTKVMLRNEALVSADGAATFRAAVYNPNDQPLRCSLRVRRPANGWKPKQSGELKWEAPSGWSMSRPLMLTTSQPVAGRTEVGRLVCTVGGETTGEAAFVWPMREVEIGDRVGWITGDEDPLLKAATALGSDVERIEDLRSADLSVYGTIFVGDEAFNKDFAHIRDAYLRLQQFAWSGGKVIVGQLNDDKWRMNFLPYDIVVDDAETRSGAIVATAHPLFNDPNELRNLRGVMSYDHIALVDGPWRALVRDEERRPSVLEADLGRGSFLVIMPSFDREVTAEKPESKELAKRSEEFLTNLLAYAKAR